MLIDPGLPIVGYRFVVVIFTGLLAPNPVDIQFQEVDGLSKDRSISLENGMMTLGESTSAKTLTLKRGVFTSISPLIIGNIAESLFWDTRMLRKDFMISILDEDDQPVNAWLVSNAYLESWDWSGINADGGKWVIESMKFKYTGIQYLPLKLTKTGR
jgi:phage tail-like protein